MKRTETFIFYGTWSKDRGNYTEHFIILGDPLACQKYFMKPTKDSLNEVLAQSCLLKAPCNVEVEYCNFKKEVNNKTYWNKYIYSIKSLGV